MAAVGFIWATVISWRVLLASAASILVVFTATIVTVGKSLGVQSKPLTDGQISAAKMFGVSLANALTIGNGGRYGGQRRIMRKIDARSRALKVRR